jgi:hypothetical protein
LSGENAGTTLDVINIALAANDTISVSEINMNYNINEEIVIDYGIVVNFFAAVCRLMLWVALIAAAARLFRNPVGILLAAALCYLLIGSPVYIPESFIPTRWSEFEFWSYTFAHYGDVLSYYFSMKTYAPDDIFRAYIIKGLLYAAISGALFFIWLLKQYPAVLYFFNDRK